jgi:hypothetical protein
VNWEAVGAVGEIIGALGVMLSLGYLASQIRMQNRESRLAASTEWTNQWNDFLSSFAEHPVLCEVWSKGLKDFSSLSAPEVVQFSSHLGRLFRVAEGIHDQYRQGRFDPKTWRGVARTIEDVALFPGAKAWWPTRSRWYSDEFAALVQRRSIPRSRRECTARRILLDERWRMTFNASRRRCASVKRSLFPPSISRSARISSCWYATIVSCSRRIQPDSARSVPKLDRLTSSTIPQA